MKYLKDQTPQLRSIKPASILDSFDDNSWKPVILGDFLRRKGKFYYKNAIFFCFYLLKMNFDKCFET